MSSTKIIYGLDCIPMGEKGGSSRGGWAHFEYFDIPLKTMPRGGHIFGEITV